LGDWSEAGAGEDREAGVLGKLRIAEAELAEEKEGVFGGGDFSGVDAGGAQTGVIGLFLGLGLFFLNGHSLKLATTRNSKAKFKGTGLKTRRYNFTIEAAARVADQSAVEPAAYPELRVGCRPQVLPELARKAGWKLSLEHR